MIIKKKGLTLLIISLSFLFLGWGSAGHKIINGKAALSFTGGIDFMKSWAGFLADHGSDADRRKSQYPEESPKHYIDIDAYPEFVNSGEINPNYDSLIAKHGSLFVGDNGTLPWAILDAVDSLQSLFEKSDWDKAKLIAADLGHYVGDAHMPLHLTKNYNGQYSGTYGIHSRYESAMIEKYSGLFSYTGESLKYIENRSDYVFRFIYSNYKYVDSVTHADEYSLSIAGNYNSTYYQELWDITGKFTVMLFKNASNILANLIYSAWLDAGSPGLTSVNNEANFVNNYSLKQNYPNPFNPTTTIEYSIPHTEFEISNQSIGRQLSVIVALKVFDLLGRQIAVLVNELQTPGKYSVVFNGADLASGVYLYSIKIGDLIEMKKMLLSK